MESITWECEKFTEEQKKQIENIPDVSKVKYECGRVQIFLRTPLNATDADKKQINNSNPSAYCNECMPLQLPYQPSLLGV